jgi:hypothetical protein
VYVSSANLAAAFQRMISEPRAKQHRPSEVHEFVVLNHILSSNVASITSAMLTSNERPPQLQSLLKPVRHAQQALHRSLRLLDPTAPDVAPATEPTGLAATTIPDTQMVEQLDFIQKVSSDIRKITEETLSAEEPRRRRQPA